MIEKMTTAKEEADWINSLLIRNTLDELERKLEKLELKLQNKARVELKRKKSKIFKT